MKILHTKLELRRAMEAFRKKQEGVTGLVPTMGYLHNGHRSLMEQARKECDFVMVNIFVNPLQFNDEGDFQSYPIDHERDAAICEAAGVDLLFIPDVEEMLGNQKPQIILTSPALTSVLCGPGRPGHFEGVMLIVSRLFHIFAPERAYFGMKDFQQYTIIRRMVDDLGFPVKVIGCATVREEDGLAMSSRNVRLSIEDRSHAILIYRALMLGKKSHEEGERNSATLIEVMKDVIHSGSKNRVEYLQIVQPDTLQPLEILTPGQPFVIATAVFCDNVRLIDNILVNQS